MKAMIETLLELTRSVMIAETISLGILALPKALAVLGLVPYESTAPFPVIANDELTPLFQRRSDHTWSWDYLDLYCIYDRAIQMPPCAGSQHG